MGLQVTGYRLQVTGYRLQAESVVVLDSRFRGNDRDMPVTCNL